MTAITGVSAEIGTDLPAEPYPGLRCFEPNEWAIFFGREPMIDEVIGRLAEHHLVVVHGASGCGKSSLVRAGVLPWLDLDHARSAIGWKKALMRPSGGPLHNLAKALADQLGPPPGTTLPTDMLAAWHDHLASGSHVLDCIEQALQADGGASFCLLVDQFEELFRYERERSREETKLFVELMGTIAEGHAPHLFVILTMRSDYLGQCSQFDGFAETVNRCQYLLPRMDDFALLRVIHEPAPLYGGTVAPAVGDRLLFAIRREEDALPVLQHTLTRACRYARARHGKPEGWTVTPEDVETIEGECGALSTHADEVLAAVVGEDAKRGKTAEWLFRSLTDIDTEGRVIRRPCRLGDLIKVTGGDRQPLSRP